MTLESFLFDRVELTPAELCAAHFAVLSDAWQEREARDADDRAHAALIWSQVFGD